jgi:hypothetical protein
MKIFIDVASDPNNENPGYVNILNINYICSQHSNGRTSTKIVFKGSDPLFTNLNSKEIIRRIDMALNGINPSKIIERFELMEIEE